MSPSPSKVNRQTPKKSSKKTDPNVTETDGFKTETENLSKIRDIIFGTQMRDYENRFVSIEKHFQQSIRDLQSSVEARLHKLDLQIQRMEKEINTKLDSERQARHAALEAEAKQRDAVGEKLSADILHLDEKASMAAADLDQLLDAKTTQLEKEFEQQAEDLESKLQKTHVDLSDTKLDRHLMAEMLLELAQRINKG